MEVAEEEPGAAELEAIAPEVVVLEGALVPVVGPEDLEGQQVLAVLFEQPPAVAEEEQEAKHSSWRPVGPLRVKKPVALVPSLLKAQLKRW